MNWFVTGGCGFIGINLIEYLSSISDARIRIYDNFSVCGPTELRQICAFKRIKPKKCNAIWDDGEVSLVNGDILAKSDLFSAMNGADVVVHLAANTGVPYSITNPEQDCFVNVMGTLNCLDAATRHKIKRFIFASSGAPIGEVAPPIHEELAPHPKSPYGASKLAGEGYCHAYAGSFGLSTVMLRFSNVFGPYSIHKNSVIAKFIKAVIKGEELEIYGDGSQTRDYIFVEDLVRAIYISSLKEGLKGEIFQIATNVETSIGDLIIELQQVFEKYEIKFPDINNLPVRTGDVKRNYSDISKAKKMLGWNPIVQLSSGLHTTVSWFLDQSKKGLLHGK